MITTHNLGFPRIGAQRELKFALESYWKGQLPAADLHALGHTLRQRHWTQQADLDWLPVGDFSFYDQVLDMSQTLGNLPARALHGHGTELDAYFRVARGRSAPGQADPACCTAHAVAAGEMTKWFDTNYHYIVPEFDAHTHFALHADRLVAQLQEALAQGHAAKPVLIGPVTYLALGKSKDGTSKLSLLPQLLNVYAELIEVLVQHGATWIQMDEPILVTELDADWKHAFQTAYHQLKPCRAKLLLTTYFGPLQDNLHLAATLPVAGLHLDAITGREDVPALLNLLPSHKVLSLGVVNGRNIWKTDLNATLDWLAPLHDRLGDRLWLAPSCALLHVPVDLSSEQHLPTDVQRWLAFAVQKLDEVRTLAHALNHGRESVHAALQAERPDLGYAAVLRLMQVMHGKGLLSRDERSRAHVYAPVEARERLQTNLLGDFIRQAFAGSGKALVLAALQGGHLSAKEREELRTLLGKEDA